MREVALLRAVTGLQIKLNLLFISMSQSGNCVRSNANCSNLFSKSFGVKCVFVCVLNTMNYLPKDQPKFVRNFIENFAPLVKSILSGIFESCLSFCCCSSSGKYDC